MQWRPGPDVSSRQQSKHSAWDRAGGVVQTSQPRHTGSFPSIMPHYTFCLSPGTHHCTLQSGGLLVKIDVNFLLLADIFNPKRVNTYQNRKISLQRVKIQCRCTKRRSKSLLIPHSCIRHLRFILGINVFIKGFFDSGQSRGSQKLNHNHNND